MTDAVTLDAETGEVTPAAQVIDVKPVTVTVTTPPAQPAPSNGGTQAKPTRPYDPETLKIGLNQKAEKNKTLVATEAHRGALVAALEALFPSETREVREMCRHDLTKYLFGRESTKDLTGGQVHTLLGWAQERLDSGEFAPDPTAAQEAHKVIVLIGAHYQAEQEPEPLALAL
jgi:hypothetical protein